MMVFFSLFSTGCIERRMTIQSDPPGATVWIDGKPAGKTPLSAPFVFYGTREFTFHREGYEIFSTLEKVHPPVYQYFPIDFVSEFLLPFTLLDEHSFFYTLKPYFPKTSAQKQELEKKAGLLRNEFQAQKAEKK